jgi:hypothetical protein
MRLVHAMLLLPLFVTPAFAQSTTTPTTDHHGRRSAEQHFADANTTHDGHLTLEQAQTGYKSLAKSFPQIDVNHHGYTTMDDIKAWRAAKKAAHQAAKRAAEGETPQVPAKWNWHSPEVSAPAPGHILPTPVQAPRNGVDLPTAPLDNGRSS